MADKQLDIFGSRNLQVEAFLPKEEEIFNTAWDYMVRTLNRQVSLMVWDGRHKETTRILAQVFKREKGGAAFEGMNPRTGIGMRLPDVRDLLGAPTEVWDVTWATAGFRNWSSTAAPDASTFDASVPVQLIDAAQDFWDLVLFGFGNFNASPKEKEAIIEINSETYPIQNIEWGMRGTEMAVAEFDAAYFIQRASRERIGFHVRTLGTSAPFPIGVIFESNIRSKTQLKNRAT